MGISYVASQWSTTLHKSKIHKFVGDIVHVLLPRGNVVTTVRPKEDCETSTCAV